VWIVPTYEYECLKCGHHFERFQSMTEEPVKRCEECKGKVRRLLGTGAGILFKGSGFYQTDYRSSSYQEAAKKDTNKASAAKSEATSKKKAKEGASSKTPSTGSANK
jgi:putative FmdB family regulatory protein